MPIEAVFETLLELNCLLHILKTARMLCPQLNQSQYSHLSLHTKCSKYIKKLYNRENQITVENHGDLIHKLLEDLS